ncbi:MAG: COG4315 family predicted lipoprotein [Candidatus Dormibacteraceae bacterium]
MRIPLAFAVAGVMVASCGGTPTSQVSTSPTPTTQAVIAVVVKAVKGQQEPVLVNSNAMTLYYLTSDTSTKVACQGQCATFWPPLLLPSGAPSSGTSLSGALSVLTDANGRQVLYNGHPLYAFSKDKTSSDVNGEGINAFGGTWHVATPNLAAA